MAIKLRQATEIEVRIGPAVAVGDGFTPVTTLNLGTADEAELLKANGAATASLAAATFAAVTGADGWYDLTLTTSHTDTVGELVVAINDDSLILPIFMRFEVISAPLYDTQVSGSGITAGLATGTPTSTVVPGWTALVAANDYYNGSLLWVLSGTGAGQIRQITDYVGSTDTFTVDPAFVTTLDTTSFCVVVPSPPNPTTLLPEVDVVHLAGSETNVTELNAIVEDLKDGGRLDLIVDAILNDTDVIDDGTSGLVKIAQDVAAVLADTAVIGSTGQGLTSLATAAALATVDGEIEAIDTVVDAIKAKTDSLAFTVANQVDANVQGINDVGIVGDGAATPFDVA